MSSFCVFIQNQTYHYVKELLENKPEKNVEAVSLYYWQRRPIVLKIFHCSRQCICSTNEN